VSHAPSYPPPSQPNPRYDPYQSGSAYPPHAYPPPAYPPPAYPPPAYPPPAYPPHPGYPGSGPAGEGTTPRSPWRYLVAVLAVGLAAVLGYGGYRAVTALSDDSNPYTARQVATGHQTTIVFPKAVHGLTRIDGSFDKAIRMVVARMPKEAHARGAVYGRKGQLRAVVVAGAYDFGPIGRESFLAGAKEAAKQHGMSTHAVDPGPLKGRMQCGTTRDGFTTQCAFVDSSAYGVIQVVGKGASARTLVLALRAGIERTVT
jgi:hypothetical protein